MVLEKITFINNLDVQHNLQIQYNSYKILITFFTETEKPTSKSRKHNLKIHMESQRPQIANAILSKKKIKTNISKYTATIQSK